jgi:hypothetical protein
MAPGVGFIMMYLLGEQEVGLLVPGGILLAVGILFLSANDWAWKWWPVVLIVVGALILLRPPKAPIAQPLAEDPGGPLPDHPDHAGADIPEGPEETA